MEGPAARFMKRNWSIYTDGTAPIGNMRSRRAILARPSRESAPSLVPWRSRGCPALSSILRELNGHGGADRESAQPGDQRRASGLSQPRGRVGDVGVPYYSLELTGTAHMGVGQFREFGTGRAQA